MNSYFDLVYLKKTAKVNYVILTIMLAISVSAHAIANRLVEINGYPIIAAGFIYMSVFVITDIFACFNSRKFVIFVLVLEAFFNLFFVLYTTNISGLPYPNYFPNSEAYKIVFQPIAILYIANLGGTFVSAVVDLYIFKFLYNRKKWMFFTSSFFSSIVTISCYTYITDYFGFRELYPDNVIQLTHVNLCTNFITLLIYALIGQFIVSSINRYLKR